MARGHSRRRTGPFSAEVAPPPASPPPTARPGGAAEAPLGVAYVLAWFGGAAEAPLGVACVLAWFGGVVVAPVLALAARRSPLAAGIRALLGSLARLR